MHEKLEDTQQLVLKYMWREFDGVQSLLDLWSTLALQGT
jgi:hypothetical protein